MARDKAPSDRDLKGRPPRWGAQYWYLPFMLLAIWVWQSMMVQFSYKTIPYSEFKARLAQESETFLERLADRRLLPCDAIYVERHPGIGGAGCVRAREDKVDEAGEQLKVDTREIFRGWE